MVSHRLHPSLDSSSNIYDLLPEFNDFAGGFLNYNFKGDQNIAYLKYMEEWGIYIGVTMKHEDRIKGLDITILCNNLLVGLVVIAGGGLVTVFLIRSINKPLQELAEKSVRVGDGDDTIDFASANKDVIGRLTNSLGVMVTKSKEMLQYFYYYDVP